jgi:hypothetical protein
MYISVWNTDYLPISSAYYLGLIGSFTFIWNTRVLTYFKCLHLLFFQNDSISKDLVYWSIRRTHSAYYVLHFYLEPIFCYQCLKNCQVLVSTLLSKWFNKQGSCLLVRRTCLLGPSRLFRTHFLLPMFNKLSSACVHSVVKMIK